MKPSRIFRLSTFSTASCFFHFFAIQQLAVHDTAPQAARTVLSRYITNELQLR